jgi:hypothetical protein
VPDVTAPSVPTGLRVTTRTSSTAEVVWDASTDTGGSGLKGYLVTVDDGAAVLTTSTGTTVTGPPTSLHTVTVVAVDNAGNQSGAAVLNPVRIAPAGPPSGPNEVYLPFDNSTISLSVVNLDPDQCTAATLTMAAPPAIPTQTVDTSAVSGSGGVTFQFTVDINDGTVTPGGFTIDRYLDPYDLVVACGPLPPVTIIGHPVIIGP